MPGQDCAGGPGGVSIGEPDPKGLRAGEPAMLLATGCIGWADLGNAGELTWMVIVRESWWSDQPNYNPDPEPEL